MDKFRVTACIGLKLATYTTQLIVKIKINCHKKSRTFVSPPTRRLTLFSGCRRKCSSGFLWMTRTYDSSRCLSDENVQNHPAQLSDGKENKSPKTQYFSKNSTKLSEKTKVEASISILMIDHDLSMKKYFKEKEDFRRLVQMKNSRRTLYSLILAARQ